MRRIERMRERLGGDARVRTCQPRGLEGRAARASTGRTPKKQLQLPVHPLDPRHPLRPSVLDACGVRGCVSADATPAISTEKQLHVTRRRRERGERARPQRDAVWMRTAKSYSFFGLRMAGAVRRFEPLDPESISPRPPRLRVTSLASRAGGSRGPVLGAGMPGAPQTESRCVLAKPPRPAL